MAAKTTTTSVTLAALILGVGIAAGGTTGKGSFPIDVKATAREQYNYASRILATSPDKNERDIEVIRSVAALEVIPKTWPNDRVMSLLAYGEIVTRLNGARMYQNAIDFCDKAIAYVGNTPQRLVFVAAKGRALMWLNRVSEAQVAFSEATNGRGVESLSDHEKSIIFRDAGLFHERQGNYRASAQDARTLAKYSPDDLFRAEALRRAVDLSLMAGDNENARTDLNNLSDVAIRARLRNLQPPEQELLRRIDAAIVEYRKKVHG